MSDKKIQNTLNLLQQRISRQEFVQSQNIVPPLNKKRLSHLSRTVRHEVIDLTKDNNDTQPMQSSPVAVAQPVQSSPAAAAALVQVPKKSLAPVYRGTNRPIEPQTTHYKMHQDIYTGKYGTYKSSKFASQIEELANRSFQKDKYAVSKIMILLDLVQPGDTLYVTSKFDTKNNVEEKLNVQTDLPLTLKKMLFVHDNSTIVIDTGNQNIKIAVKPQRALLELKTFNERCSKQAWLNQND